MSSLACSAAASASKDGTTLLRTDAERVKLAKVRAASERGLGDPPRGRSDDERGSGGPAVTGMLLHLPCGKADSASSSGEAGAGLRPERDARPNIEDRKDRGREDG